MVIISARQEKISAIVAKIAAIVMIQYAVGLKATLLVVQIVAIVGIMCVVNQEQGVVKPHKIVVIVVIVTMEYVVRLKTTSIVVKIVAIVGITIVVVFREKMYKTVVRIV